MRKFNTILFLSLSLLAAYSCAEPVAEEQESVITIRQSNLIIPAKGGDATIKFTSKVPLIVVSDKDWCDVVSVDDTLATFTAKPNESFESRYANVIAKAGDETLNFTIQQYGYYTSGFAPEDISTSAAAATFDFPYEYEEAIVAETAADWITLTVTGDNLKVALAENTLVGTPENPSRKAEIKWTLGFESGVINVTQSNTSFMKEDSNWTVTYDGIQKAENGEDVAVISNTVKTPGISGKWATFVTSKAAFTNSGMAMDDFAVLASDAAREEIEESVEYYVSNGYDATFSDFLYEDSASDAYYPFNAGEYIAFAIGFTDDKAATGHYAYKNFTVKGGGSSPTGYDAWLGEWETKRGSSTDTWKIVAKEEGKTYTITGIEGYDYPVTASYLATTQGIEVRAQAEIGTLSTSNYGECSVGLYGGWGDSNFATGTYPIFTAAISGSTATLTPEKVSFNDGSSYMLERVQLIATTSDSKYLSVSKDKTPLPTTLTRKGGGGDEPGPGEGSEAYRKFIGSWTMPDETDGTFTMSLRQNTADKSYWMRGWHMEEDFFEDVEATFESDGSVVIYANSTTPVASNVDIGADEGPCDLFYVGRILDGGKEYYITSKGDYGVANGRMKSDGSVEFTGLQVELSDGSTFDFVRMDIIAIPISDPDGGAYSFKNKPKMFPLTATKASSSSVKAMGSVQSGEWVKVPADRKFMAAARPTVKVYGFCTPYQAMPDSPVKFPRHINVK